MGPHVGIDNVTWDSHTALRTILNEKQTIHNTYSWKISRRKALAETMAQKRRRHLDIWQHGRENLDRSPVETSERTIQVNIGNNPTTMDAFSQIQRLSKMTANNTIL